jgi:hypothetical protein
MVTPVRDSCVIMLSASVEEVAMGLKKGEAIVLIVSSSGVEPGKYFLAVRRSEVWEFDKGKDFHIGSPQIPVAELGHCADVGKALDEAVAAIKGALGLGSPRA